MPANGVIYSMVSHTSQHVAAQHAALTKYLPTFRIVFVEDVTYPCEPTLDFSKLCVHLNFKRGNGVKRASKIVTHILRHIVPKQAERYAVIIHSDMTPTKYLEPVNIFNRQRFVVVGQQKKDGTLGWFTQLLGIDTKHGISSSWEKWPIDDCHVLPCRKIMGRDNKHYEEISDCWHHATRISRTVTPIPVATAPRDVLNMRKHKGKSQKCGSCGKKHTKATVKKAIKQASKRKKINLKKLRKELS